MDEDQSSRPRNGASINITDENPRSESGGVIGRIKRMENDKGEEISAAGPSVPVRIIGFTEAPENGEKVYCFKNKKQALARKANQKSMPGKQTMSKRSHLIPVV